MQSDPLIGGLVPRIEHHCALEVMLEKMVDLVRHVVESERLRHAQSDDGEATARAYEVEQSNTIFIPLLRNQNDLSGEVVAACSARNLSMLIGSNSVPLRIAPVGQDHDASRRIDVVHVLIMVDAARAAPRFAALPLDALDAPAS